MLTDFDPEFDRQTHTAPFSKYPRMVSKAIDLIQSYNNIAKLKSHPNKKTKGANILSLEKRRLSGSEASYRYKIIYLFFCRFR